VPVLGVAAHVLDVEVGAFEELIPRAVLVRDLEDHDRVRLAERVHDLAVLAEDRPRHLASATGVECELRVRCVVEVLAVPVLAVPLGAIDPDFAARQRAPLPGVERERIALPE
jgi:hypothetical protein